MKNANESQSPEIEESKEANGGYAVLKPGGPYRGEAVAFLRERLGDDFLNRITTWRKSIMRHPYVAAKLFLSVDDWNKYVWIEWHGTLEGYSPGAGKADTLTQDARPLPRAHK